MPHGASGFDGCFSAPHTAAALAGRDVLGAGGTAIEAMVAAAATIAVTYPHMNGIGGDGFWLIRRAGQRPVGISGCGRAAGLATPKWYAAHGHAGAIPVRGPLAALTVPGTLDGWRKALDLVPAARRIPLPDLLAPAIAYARDGIAVTDGQSRYTAEKLDGLGRAPGFADIFLADGAPPPPGHTLCQPALADTLQTIATQGVDAFYRGDIAAEHARFLTAEGSPLRAADFTGFKAEMVEPLSVRTSDGTLYNLGPPTQGIASLMILALFDRLGIAEPEGFDHVHGIVEATKQAFLVRNAVLGDPDSMPRPPATWLDDSFLDTLAAKINRNIAMPWPHPARDGDTIWMGAVDREGTAVSFIQSVYWEFGSGLTCPTTGVVFQNRGAGFSLKPGPNQLAPRKRPFHTLNPALAELNDGRVIAYGTMGGEGQPQTQAAVFTRHVRFGQGLQQSISAPRWLLGRTWGDVSTSLKLENRWDGKVVDALRAAGHQVELIDGFSDLMGHAGAVVLHRNGLMEAATDPRADGAAIAF